MIEEIKKEMYIKLTIQNIEIIRILSSYFLKNEH